MGLAICGCAGLLGGCGSASITPKVDTAMYRRLVPPLVIHVQPFDTTGGVWEGGASAQNVRGEIRDALARELVARLGEIAPAQLHRGLQPPPDGWLVTGKFVHVSAPRWNSLGPVGFGHGKSKFITEVSVYDLAESATDPILVFATTDGTGHKIGVDVFGKQDHDETGDEIARTADEVRDYLLEKLVGP